MTTDKAHRAKILSRIRKCLALAESSNPNEAAAALRQAQKMMAQHNINTADVDMSAVSEAQVTAGRSAHVPPAWLAALAQTVEKAFGVKMLYMTQRHRASKFCFFGLGASAQVAGYAFTVLRRQCEAARAAYFASIMARHSARIARADMYATGWVAAVEEKVMAFAQKVPGVVNDYIYAQKAKPTAPIDRRKESDVAHARQGYLDGQNVRIHHGVGETLAKKLEAQKT